MAYSFPEGSYFQFSEFADFAAAKTVSAVTNASEAVATSTAHGYVDGDEILFTSAWEEATDTIFRANQWTADTFGFVGLDSTSTELYPAAGGAGTTQKVATWTTIPQVLTVSTSGGDPRFTTISPLARRTAINVPTGFNPTTITLTMGDDPANAVIQSMLAISRTLSKIGFKMVVPGQGSTYGFGYMSISEVAQLAVGQTNQRTAVLTLLGKAMSYAAA
jgi:hypothetical protein